MGFISIENNQFKHYFLSPRFSVSPGPIETSLTEYRKPTAMGLDGSGRANDWVTVDLENPGVLLRGKSGIEMVIYWPEGKFHSLVSED